MWRRRVGRAKRNPPSLLRRRLMGFASLYPSYELLLCLTPLLKMLPSLQIDQQDEARNCRRCAEHEIADPARRVGHVSATCCEDSASECRQRGQQCILRGRVQRIVAQRGEIGDQRYRAERGGELLDGDRKGQPCKVAANQRLPCESEDRDRLKNAADPQALAQP